MVYPPIRAPHALVSAPQEPFLAPQLPSNSLTPLQDCIIHTVLRNVFVTDILSIGELECCVNFYCRTESLSHTHTFFSITVYRRILNIVFCTIQQDLAVYPSYNSLHQIITNSQSCPSLPFSPWQPQVCLCAASPFLFHR